MRRIEMPARALAERFSGFLSNAGIENRVEEEDGAWGIWVYRDAQLHEAKTHLEAFRQEPEANQFMQGHATWKKQQVRRQVQENLAKKSREKQLEVERQLTAQSKSIGIFTACVLMVTVGFAVWTNVGMSDAGIDRMAPFYMSEFIRPTLPEILSGEVWRLITPVFLHFGFLHLGFNLMAFVYLGQMIERRKGTLILIGLFLTSAVFSNVAQYIASGPGFGGLSGVDYALLGYVWMKSRFDPFSGFYLSDQTVMFALVWLVVCFTGMMGPVANFAHLSGLCWGVIWGYFASRVLR